MDQSRSMEICVLTMWTYLCKFYRTCTNLIHVYIITVYICNHASCFHAIYPVSSYVLLCVSFIFQLVCISRTSESFSDLQLQLNYAYLQILSVLTGSVKSILESRPQYDIRNLMGGTEALLTDLLTEADR